MAFINEKCSTTFAIKRILRYSREQQSSQVAIRHCRHSGITISLFLIFGFGIMRIMQLEVERSTDGLESQNPITRIFRVRMEESPSLKAWGLRGQNLKLQLFLVQEEWMRMGGWGGGGGGSFLHHLYNRNLLCEDGISRLQVLLKHFAFLSFFLSCFVLC